MTASNTAAVPDDIRNAVRDAVAKGLIGTYYCGRVWEAWQVNTMREDDFTPAEEVDDVVDEITDAAIAALSQPAAAPMSGWKPIGTAPLDGSHVLCYAPELQFAGFYGGRSGWCYVAPGVPVAPTQPTHWMPLPAAPGTEAAPVEQDAVREQLVAALDHLIATLGHCLGLTPHCTLEISKRYVPRVEDAIEKARAALAATGAKP